MREESAVLALDLVHLEAELHVGSASGQLALDDLRVSLGGVEPLQPREWCARWGSDEHERLAVGHHLPHTTLYTRLAEIPRRVGLWIAHREIEAPTCGKVGAPVFPDGCFLSYARLGVELDNVRALPLRSLISYGL